MTYQSDHLTWDEYRVWLAAGHLASAGRTANTSQIARWTSISRTSVAAITMTMSARGWLADAGKGNAHHWRQTSRVPAVAPSRHHNASHAATGHQESGHSESAAMSARHEDARHA